MNQEQNHQEEQAQDQGAPEELHIDQLPENNSETSKNIIIIVVLAVIVVVLALMYMWGSSVQEKASTENETEVATIELPADGQIESLKQVSTSDEIVKIENDLNMTELENLDADLIQLEAEIDAAIEE